MGEHGLECSDTGQGQVAGTCINAVMKLRVP